MIRQRSSSLTHSDGMEMNHIALDSVSKHVPFTINDSHDSFHDYSRTSDELTDLEDATLLLKDELPRPVTRWWSFLYNRKLSIFITLSAFTIVAILFTKSRSSPKQPFQPKVSQSWPGFNGIENYIPFGDSWTTSHFWVEGLQPSPANPIGNPAFPGFTSSNGQNYVSYLATTYNTSFIRAFNFAYSGSVIDAKIDFTMLPWLDFPHQIQGEFLDWYIPSPHQKANWTSNNTLFSTFFGINDILVYNRSTHRIDEIFETYESSYGVLHDHGARNFLLMNIPPLDRSPAVTEGHTKKEDDEYKRDVGSFNFMIERMAERMKKMEGVSVFLYDVHELFGSVLNGDVVVEGVKDLGYCKAYEWFEKERKANETEIESCGGLDVDEFLWLNKLHVTERIHGVMAKEIAAMLSGVPAWMNKTG